jgi:GntR family histidine utilization transcriptional repressor
MTINRALRELTAEGLLRRIHGLGTFIAEPPRHAHLVELMSIADEIAQQGKEHSSQLLSLETIAADAELSERMQLLEQTAVFKVVLVHFQDEIPIQIEIRHVNPALVPDFLQVDFSQTTPAEHLIKSIRPDELEHIVQAIMPSEFIAAHLDIPRSEPCLKLRRRTWKDHQVVTTADLIYPSSRYDLGARYAPPFKPN